MSTQSEVWSVCLHLSPSLWPWAHQTSAGSPASSLPVRSGRTPEASGTWPTARWPGVVSGCLWTRAGCGGWGSSTLRDRRHEIEILNCDNRWFQGLVTGIMNFIAMIRCPQCRDKLEEVMEMDFHPSRKGEKVSAKDVQTQCWISGWGGAKQTECWLWRRGPALCYSEATWEVWGFAHPVYILHPSFRRCCVGVFVGLHHGSLTVPVCNFYRQVLKVHQEEKWV